MRLKSKVAVVTGAASGFGKKIAELFAQEGAKVALLDRDGAGANKAAESIDKNALSLTCDVSSGSDVKNAIEKTLDKWGQVDIVINNAAISHRNQPMLDVSEEEFEQLFSVNVGSIFHMAKAVVPHMRSTGQGVIINIGSTAAIRPRPGLVWYNGTKGAVHVMTLSMAAELAADQIRVCAIAPVLGRTALLETFTGEPLTDGIPEKFISTIPLGRISEPLDIAQAALFLASDEASFLTGTILPVDGGRCI